jgi:hypothetical protein
MVYRHREQAHSYRDLSSTGGLWWLIRPGSWPEREVVFQRFYRAEGGQPHSGFGLGLSIVAAIVSLHGFTLAVGSSDLGGAKLALDCKQSLISQS